MNASRILMVMGGPNGSGKSTITSSYQPIGHYINADDIQRHLNCDIYEAAQIAEKTREYMLENKQNFTFESVLSTPRNYELMARAKKQGYRVVCIYVLTYDVEINVARVKSRVSQGGHDVPADKIRARYFRAMELFPRLFEVCDELYVYDNSFDRTLGEPAMILKAQYGVVEIFTSPIWSQKMIENLCNGVYGKN